MALPQTDLDYADAVKALADDLARQGTDNFKPDDGLLRTVVAALEQVSVVAFEDRDNCAGVAQLVLAAAGIGIYAERFKHREIVNPLSAAQYAALRDAAWAEHHQRCDTDGDDVRGGGDVS